ncbi:MAG: type II toxin-antitoxin system RelB/DinJ family antitoxin [Clostridiales bacterium]|nr:type II toxin-antitoxin system RelB/DinJ family antitoxin [Clostridiales bacterium]
MATKTANVLARVEPDVKEQAEAIMAKLGVPASTVINMLYKQIIMTRSIPFSLSVPNAPIARDEMNTAAFDAMMSEGLAQAKAGQGLSLEDSFSLLYKDV